MPEVTAVRAFSDNYIWVLSAGDEARVAVVDPGDAAPVRRYLEQSGRALGAILLTHHHPDHTGGVDALRTLADIPVYGPAEAGRVCKVDHIVADGAQLRLGWLGLALEVIAVAGHTSGHVALHGAGLLFSGDTLFRGGCGRLFEGDAAQMRAALQRLRGLPDSTQVFCGHEYTIRNLEFAALVEPANAAVTAALNAARDDRAHDRPTLPSTIGEERAINPFLRWDHPDVVAAAQARADCGNDADAVFATIRQWKDAS